MIRVPLSHGKEALINNHDWSLVSRYSWRAKRDKKNGVWYALLAARPYTAMHRLLLPTIPRIDHCNRDGLDNRRRNLRAATRSQNRANARRASNNSSGSKGVSWRKQHGKWRAYITHNGNQIHLGYFARLQDAARAYQQAAARLFGSFYRAA